MRRRVRVGEATMATTSEETRKELVCAAQEELIQGQGHLEMQAVARRVQVSVGLAYHHFGSKAGLIADVVEEFYSRLDAAAFSGAKLLSKTWADRERERIAAYVAFHYNHPLAPLVIGALSRAPEILDVERAFTNRQLAAALRLTANTDSGVCDRTEVA
jgi:AcrR family transcriptional regulator